MGSSVKQKNPTALKDRIAAMPRVVIKVGVQGTTANRQHGKVTVCDIAAIHEFGLGNVPERSWLRAWYDEHEAEAVAMIRKGYQKVISGEINAQTLATAFGVWAVASIQERISAGISPALNPETVDSKGSSVPLIDTGLLRSSITFVVSVDGNPLAGVMVNP